MEPITGQNVLISTMNDGTQNFCLGPLRGIWNQFTQVNRLLDNWITETSKAPVRVHQIENDHLLKHRATVVQNTQTIDADFDITNTIPPRALSAFKTQEQILQGKNVATEKHSSPTADSRKKLELVEEKYASTLALNKQITEEKCSLQKELEKLDAQYRAATKHSNNSAELNQHNLAHCNTGIGDTRLIAETQHNGQLLKPLQTKNAEEQHHCRITEDTNHLRANSALCTATRDPTIGSIHPIAGASTVNQSTEGDQPPTNGEEKNILQQGTALPQEQMVAADKTKNYHENQTLKHKLDLLQKNYAAAEERNHLIDEDNKHKSILYAAALEKIHQTTKEHQKTITENQQFHRQIQTLQSQQIAEIEHLNNRHQQESSLLQSEHTAALLKTQQLVEETKQIAEQKIAILQTQYAAAQQLVAKTQQVEDTSRAQREKLLLDHKNRKQIAVTTQQELTRLRTIISELRQNTTATLTAFQEEIKTYNAQITNTDPDRVMELTRMEAFNLWLQQQHATEEQISPQTLLQRVSAKMNHTLRNLKGELHQATTERDELQARIDQQEDTRDTLGEGNRDNFANWATLIEQEKIEDTDNLISATRKNLAPPVSIFQYYQAYKPMILNQSSLPDLRCKTHLSHEQFRTLWNKANSKARDLLVFMWVLKDLLIPRGVVEITTANSPFYITRFCTSALAHINRHHEEFYSNMENRNSLPQLDPYDLEVVKEIQDMANDIFPEFLTTVDNLAGEDTTSLHEASQQHQNLCKKFPDSFPQNFHRIQLNGYITRALEDRKHTLEQRIVSTPHSRTLLYLPQYDPGTMKIPKRS